MAILLAFSAPLAAVADAVEVSTYAQLAQAAANNETAIKIIKSIRFGASDAPVVFTNSVSITAQEGADYSLSRDTTDPGNTGRLIEVRDSGDEENPNTLTLENLTLSGGSAFMNGGAVSVLGNATLTNCAFSGNAALGNGGGLYVSGDATLTDTVFSDNTASTGGGAFIVGDATFEGDFTTFENNAARWVLPISA